MVRIRERPPTPKPVEHPKLGGRDVSFLKDVKAYPGKSGRYWVNRGYHARLMKKMHEEKWISAEASDTKITRYSAEVTNSHLTITPLGEEVLNAQTAKKFRKDRPRDIIY